mmetsp:Transcript_25096/g.82813  ORF Transcript_25096/g.82813 Transcript_25096/m.82813 type:complete len:85 (+) Transcript_25096:650-904(+)
MWTRTMVHQAYPCATSLDRLRSQWSQSLLLLVMLMKETKQTTKHYQLIAILHRIPFCHHHLNGNQLHKQPSPRILYGLVDEDVT